MRIVLTTLMAGLFALPSPAQQPASPSGSSSSEIRAENCMVQYINKVNIAAKSEGTLMELRFEEGYTVTKDDVLAVIDDTAAALALELKKAEEKEAVLNAANDVNVQDARNSEELASAEVKAFEELLREGAVPFWEVEKKRLEAKRAELRIDLADMQKKIAEVQMIAKRTEREITEFDLSQRQVTAPVTGFIERRIAQIGEWVQPGSPVATLIQMDKLRVEGDIDALRYPGQIVKGTPVEVTIYTSADQFVTLDAKLGFVSMELDLQNRYRVWVEIANTKLADSQDWSIKPGMRAEIVIKKLRPSVF
jgi:multidrug resistance efflux pump